MHILSERLCVKYYSVHETLSNTTNQFYKLLQSYEQSNTTHQLFIKHTKTATSFGFIN
jgi:hypothetical protein